MFHYNGFELSSSSWYQISCPFRINNNNVVVFQFPFHTFMPFIHPPSRMVSHPKDKKFPDLYLLIRPPRRPLALGRGSKLIPGFILSSLTSSVYGVAHSLLLVGAVRGFSFTEDETRKHFSYLSGTFREFLKHGV